MHNVGWNLVMRTALSTDKCNLLFEVSKILTWRFSRVIWHSSWMRYPRSMSDSRPKGPQLQLGHLQMGERCIDNTEYSTRLLGLV